MCKTKQSKKQGNKKLGFLCTFQVTSIMLHIEGACLSFVSKEYSQGKINLKSNSSTDEKHDYGYLISWYFKTTLYKWFLS